MMKTVFISKDWPEWKNVHPRVLAKINRDAEFEVMGVEMVNGEPTYRLIQYNQHYPQGIMLDCPIKFIKE